MIYIGNSENRKTKSLPIFFSKYIELLRKKNRKTDRKTKSLPIFWSLIFTLLHTQALLLRIIGLNSRPKRGYIGYIRRHFTTIKYI